MSRKIKTSAALVAASMFISACSSQAADEVASATTAAESAPTTEAVAVDTELAEFPEPYQDFITSVGGSKWVDVKGSAMHYVEVGDPDGEVILLGHGAPTNAYLWRDVITELEQPGRRIIAFDLIGFGRSDHPDVDYTFETHAEYMTGFIDALELEDVNLVLHDVSGQAGFGYAAANPDNVASIASFEVLYRSFESFDEMGPFAGPLFEQVRQPGVGEKIVIEDNIPIAQNLDAGTATELDPEVRDVYASFFADPESRDVNLDFIRDTPVGGEPASGAAFVDNYAEWLTNSTNTPKLVLAPEMGLVPPVQFETAKTLPNVEVGMIEGSGHFAQEDNPTLVAKQLNDFYESSGVLNASQEDDNLPPHHPR